MEGDAWDSGLNYGRMGAPLMAVGTWGAGMGGDWVGQSGEDYKWSKGKIVALWE